MTLVGALGGRARATVGPWGRVALDGVGWELEWWIGADDRWRVPAREITVRQQLVQDAPVVQTTVRVPGGDAVQRVYGVPGPPEVVVVEVTNDSPAPFVVAFVVQGARAVAADGSAVVVDGRPGLVTPRPASRWAVGAATEVEVCSGNARTGQFLPVRDRAGRLVAAFLYPVAHRTALRVGVPAGPAGPEAIDLARLASAQAAARGWRAVLDRGLRIDLPDDRLVSATRAARAQVLLAAGGRAVSAREMAALEDWGLDAEARDAWQRLSPRERRRAARRSPLPPSWAAVRDAAARGGADLLLALRGLLAHECDDGEVVVLAELPSEWRGGGIEVHDAPTRRGPVSYAVRWHGARAALLWDVPDGIVLRAPGLDPAWSTREPRGESLLGEPRCGA